VSVVVNPVLDFVVGRAWRNEGFEILSVKYRFIEELLVH